MSKCGNGVHPQKPHYPMKPGKTQRFPSTHLYLEVPIWPSLSAYMGLWITNLKVEMTPLFLAGGIPRNAYILEMSLGPRWLPWQESSPILFRQNFWMRILLQLLQ
jgi:hypothetical protein